MASQAAASFESARLFEALRETNMRMVRGQKIGRVGSYRWNTRTRLSRASRECYRIFDIDLEIKPVPYEVFKSRIHPDEARSPLAAFLAEDKIDCVCRNLPKQALITVGAFKDCQSARHCDNL